MTTQTWIEIGASGGGWVKEWAPIIGPAITGLVAIITGGAVAYFAWRNWRTAKDKLAIDLFDRRLANYRAWNLCFQSRRDLLAKHGRPGVPLYEIHEWNPDVRVAVDDSRFLFGEDIHSDILGLMSLMDDWSGSLAAMSDAATDLGRQVDKRMYRLGRAVEPYMMLDKIAVNRPAKS